MHYGRIDGETKAGAVYRVLRHRSGEWMDGWELSQAAKVTAVSTRVSEVRRQLLPSETIEHRQHYQGKRGSWYRLVPIEEGHS